MKINWGSDSIEVEPHYLKDLYPMMHCSLVAKIGSTLRSDSAEERLSKYIDIFNFVAIIMSPLEIVLLHHHQNFVQVATSHPSKVKT